MEEKQPTKKREWAVKKPAPQGYYTASEAIKKTGLNRSTFFSLVAQGKINKHVPPLRKEGFYHKKEIDALAVETELFLYTRSTDEKGTHTRVARPEDAQGIYNVLDSFGWQTTPIEQRLEWYKANPYIDYVVAKGDFIIGYIACVPYRPDAMEAIMHGSKRAWDMKPEDIYPYSSSTTYDLYVGAATRQDVMHHTMYSFRLISGFIDFLKDLKQQGVHIRYMYAVSDQEDGKRLCRTLGFVEQKAQSGDMFPRFELNLETSQSRFARMYREK